MDHNHCIIIREIFYKFFGGWQWYLIDLKPVFCPNFWEFTLCEVK